MCAKRYFKPILWVPKKSRDIILRSSVRKVNAENIHFKKRIKEESKAPVVWQADPVFCVTKGIHIALAKKMTKEDFTKDVAKLLLENNIDLKDMMKLYDFEVDKFGRNEEFLNILKTYGLHPPIEHRGRFSVLPEKIKGNKRISGLIPHSYTIEEDIDTDFLLNNADKLTPNDFSKAKALALANKNISSDKIMGLFGFKNKPIFNNVLIHLGIYPLSQFIDLSREKIVNNKSVKKRTKVELTKIMQVEKHTLNEEVKSLNFEKTKKMVPNSSKELKGESVMQSNKGLGTYSPVEAIKNGWDLKKAKILTPDDLTEEDAIFLKSNGFSYRNFKKYYSFRSDQKIAEMLRKYKLISPGFTDTKHEMSVADALAELHKFEQGLLCLNAINEKELPMSEMVEALLKDAHIKFETKINIIKAALETTKIAI